MTVQCCQCKRVREGRSWLPAPAVPDDTASHTYCPACYDNALTEVETLRASAITPAEVRAAVATVSGLASV